MVIKTLDIENPFADFGNIVEGNRFIGRLQEIQAIHNRVLGSNYGNLAIMGLPRIGKSSLAWNAIMTKKAELAKRKILIERINIGCLTSAKDFYLKLMDKTLPNVRTLSFELYDQLAATRKSYNETNSENEIEFFFALVKQSNYRLTYILDEFDNVVNLFQLEDFQLLRELSISPETKICLVTISRRTIQELEPENGAISNFYGVFSDLHLQLFNDTDMQQYWQRIEELGIYISDEYKKEVYYFVGSHPYWLDMLNYYIFNSVKSNNKNSLEVLSEIGSDLKKTLWDNYDDIISLMDKEGLKSHFIQAVVGPVVNLTKMSIERLAKYGLVKSVSAKEKYGSYFQTLIDAGLASENDISYNSISTHLDDYLKGKEEEFDIWALWIETEHQVRNLITVYLKEKYGEDWRDAFVTANSRKEIDIIRMEDMRAKNMKTFGNLASNNLVSYTYPLDMWNCFISTDWTWFQRILTGQQANWREKFLLLGKVRNPFAHSNRDFVLQDEQTKAKEICNELFERIKTWGGNQ